MATFFKRRREKTPAQAHVEIRKVESGGPCISPGVEIELVHPQVVLTPDQPADSLLEGTVTVSLRKPTKLKHIKVTAHGILSVQAGRQQPYENRSFFEKTLKIELGNGLHDTGRHVYSFLFIIPPKSPESQRSQFGRVKYYLQASAYPSAAVAKAMQSAMCIFHVVAAPLVMPDGGAGLDVAREDFVEDLGPLFFTFFAPSPALGSTFTTQLSLTCDAPVASFELQLHLVQTFTTVYDYARQKIVDTEPQFFTLLRLANHGADVHDDPVFRPLSRATIERVVLPTPGERWTSSHIIRIPVEGALRHSTHQELDTRLRCRHRLLLEIVYTPLDPVDGGAAAGPKQAFFGAPIEIAACSCLCTVGLPSYSETAAAAPPDVSDAPSANECCCDDRRRMIGCS